MMPGSQISRQQLEQFDESSEPTSVPAFCATTTFSASGRRR